MMYGLPWKTIFRYRWCDSPVTCRSDTVTGTGHWRIASRMNKIVILGKSYNISLITLCDFNTRTRYKQASIVHSAIDTKTGLYSNSNSNCVYDIKRIWHTSTLTSSSPSLCDVIFDNWSCACKSMQSWYSLVNIICERRVSLAGRKPGISPVVYKNNIWFRRFDVTWVISIGTNCTAILNYTIFLTCILHFVLSFYSTRFF